MDALLQTLDDDLDLDALMIRVREAALGAERAERAVTAPPPAEVPAGEADLVSIIAAQGEWNEHTRRALVDLVQSLQTLRDDWTEAHESLRHELARRAAPSRRAGASRPKRARRAATRGRKRS